MSDIIAPVGFRYGTVFELNANGRPKAADTDPYLGIEFYGPKAYQLNIAEPRRIAHTGKDRVLVNDQLPTLEASSAEIRVSSLDYDLDALLGGVTKFTVGDANMIARMTDKQGSEPTVGLLLYQQSKDMVTGLRNWHFHLIMAAQVTAIPASFGDNPEDHRYSVVPTPVTKHLWGVTMAENVEGALESGIIDGHMLYKPALATFLGDNTEDEFVFGFTTANNTYPVWVNGVLVTADITKTTTGFTFVTPPAASADVMAFVGRAA